MKMKNIRNTNELNRVIAGIGADIMPAVADSIAESGRAHIQAKVYDAYNNRYQMYIRSYQLRDKFVNLGKASSSNRYDTKYEVGYDLDNFLYYSRVPGYRADPALIPQLVEVGGAGGLRRKGLWRDQPSYQPHHTFAHPRPFFESFKQQVASNLLADSVDKALIQKGISFKRG